MYAKSNLIRYFSVAAALTLCLLVLNRYQIQNHFSVLPGDKFDAVIQATLLEHWFHVFSGSARWSDVGYFFPYLRTIAQTDAHFLVGVAYTPFRAAGVDPFLSADFAGWVIKAIGFLGCYVFCRRAVRLSYHWALLAAALFTLSNGMTSHSQRLALSTVAFAPVLGLLVWEACTAFLNGDFSRFRLHGFLSGLLFGAWCITCFYVAWFFAFFTSFFLFFAFVIYKRELLNAVVKRTKEGWTSVILVVVTCAISLSPFAYAFLPKSQEVGTRIYSNVVKHTIPLDGILQVGKENILFGRAYNDALKLFMTPSVSGEYYNTGFSIVLFFLFVCGCIGILKHERTKDKFLYLATLTTLVTWAADINVGGYSAWYFVFKFFPAASALNAVSVYQVFLALPVTVIAIRYLSRQNASRAILGILIAILIVGELNVPYLSLNRNEELSKLDLPNPPPKECRAFYVSGWKDQDKWTSFTPTINGIYGHNVTAMFIAQKIRIPTINGMASFNPPDWNFGFPNRPDYEERVRAYAAKHRITDLCRLDLNDKTWSSVN